MYLFVLTEGVSKFHLVLFSAQWGCWYEKDLFLIISCDVGGFSLLFIGVRELA